MPRDRIANADTDMRCMMVTSRWLVVTLRAVAGEFDDGPRLCSCTASLAAHGTANRGARRRDSEWVGPSSSADATPGGVRTVHPPRPHPVLAATATAKRLSRAALHPAAQPPCARHTPPAPRPHRTASRLECRLELTSQMSIPKGSARAATSGSRSRPIPRGCCGGRVTSATDAQQRIPTRALKGISFDSLI